MILLEIVCGIVVLNQYVGTVAGENPIVISNVGPIRGRVATDGDYNMFLGIPYAKVDKTNPFGPALAQPKFDSTFDAFDDTEKCPQIGEFNHTVVGSLDCLLVNIYVPKNAQNPLPVLVWIHGGNHEFGSGGRYLYGPSFLVKHDIIVVTINFRVGTYGYMCLGIPEVPGNEAFRDQIVALRWIKENIGAFGGDAARITISGNSSGATSVDFHLHYVKEDLFKRIIIQSGGTATIRIKESDPTVPLRIADQLNYTTSDVKDALSYLGTVNTHDVIVASDKANITYSPCIEKEFTNAINYATVHPLNLDLPRVRDVDVLIGFNDDEMYKSNFNTPDDEFNATDFVLRSINQKFDFGDDDERLTQMKEIVTHFYYGDDDITTKLRHQASHMESDFGINHGTLKTVKKYLDNKVENMYLYLFTHRSRRNFLKYRVNVTDGGAAHTDELNFLFDISFLEKPLNPDDQLMVDRMTYLWANFVKYGNPTPNGSDLVPIKWPRVTPTKMYYMKLDTELEVSSRPFHERMAFLDLFFKMNEKFQRGYKPQEKSSAAQKVALNIIFPLLFALKYFM